MISLSYCLGVQPIMAPMYINYLMCILAGCRCLHEQGMINTIRGVRSIFFSRFYRTFSVSRGPVIDVASKDGELRIFVVAGEVSGDSIGARLMASLKKISPLPMRFAGIGGDQMFQQGLKSLFPMEDIAVMGIWELLPHLNTIRVRLRETIEAASTFKPHAVVTIDSKGFSFRFLKQFRGKNVQYSSNCPTHFHYVAPSFWAWKGGEERLQGLSHFVDHIFCILPFEEKVCQSRGVGATFVGHPVLEDVLDLRLNKNSSILKVQGNSDEFSKEFGVSPGTTVISLLPGSRLQEVNRMLPIFSETVRLLKGLVPDLQPVIHVAPHRQVEELINGTIDQWPVPVILVPGSNTHLKYDAFKASKVALCASGTAAVELQLAQLPCVVAYKAHILTEWVIRYKAKVPYISLPNILLDSPLIPEALFRDCNPKRLASLVLHLIRDEKLREEQIISAEKVARLLLAPQRDTDFGENPTPSMLAASTLLYWSEAR